TSALPIYFQAIGHVVEDRHVGKQRVVLEDRVQRPVFRRGVSQVLVAQGDGAVIRMLETRHHPQQGGLAATGGPQEGNELAVKNVQIQRIQHFFAVELFGEIAQR